MTSRSTAPPPQDELLSQAEVAKRTGTCVATVRTWVADGELPAVRVGPRLIRIRASDLDAFMRPIPTMRAA